MVARARVHHTAPPDFDWVLRYLSKSSIKFSSVSSALSALSAGHKFLCCGLSALASHYLASRLSLSNVLLVLQELTLHCPKEQAIAPVCASPVRASYNRNDYPESVVMEDQDFIENKFECCESLHAKCLAYIDVHATSLLSNTSLLQVDLAVLKLLVCRTSLHIKSEMEVFSALVRWSKYECYRLVMSDSSENRRSVLSGCQYMVRYLTITPNQFKEGPMVSGLLNEEESDALLYTLLRPEAPLPDHLMVLRRNMEEPRGTGDSQPSKEEERPSCRIDNKICKLQELKEKELAYKDNYSLFDEMFLCLRCLFD